MLTGDAATVELDEAVVPGVRPLTPLVIVSLLFEGQKPPLAFFFPVYDPFSPFDVTTEPELVLGCTVDVDAVEDADEFEDNDEDELVLCTFFLCGINIRETSSALMEFSPPVEGPLFHPNRGKLGGEATAVVIEKVGCTPTGKWVDPSIRVPLIALGPQGRCLSSPGIECTKANETQGWETGVS